MRSALLAAALCVPAGAVDRPPPRGIVVILADDLGYGDVHALSPTSRIPTPSLDRLAGQGMLFTDAHAPSAVCTPTRYGLLCGRYAWRTRLRRGVLSGYSRPLVERGRQTLASVLRAAGYRTAAIGKWHLGLGWPWRRGEPEKGADRLGHQPGPSAIDWERPLTHGPRDVGFDDAWIVPGSLDMGPYVFVEGDRVAEPPVRVFPGSRFPAYVRRGPVAANFRHEDVLDVLVERATAWLEARVAARERFFLYLALTAPHKPVLPHPRYRGRTGLGPYGDLVAQVDAAVGRVLEVLADGNVAEDTLVVVTSDNGSFMFRLPEDREDHAEDATVQGYRPEHHRANGPLRGTKADVWEGDHRVPFLVRWPGVVAEGTRCARTVCLTDLLATCAEVVGADFDREASPDSFSLVPLLEGRTAAFERPAVIHHSVAGMFAVRDGRWKLVLGNGSGGRERPRGRPFARPYPLFDLDTDLAETTDLARKHPEVAERLQSAFRRLAGADVRWR